MEPYLTRVTDYLLTQSWQIALLVVVIAAVSLVLRNKSAHVRYLLWLIVLAKCLVPPLLTIPLAILPQEKPAMLFEAVGTTISEPLELPSDPVKTAPAPMVSERPAKLTIREWLGAGWMMGAITFLVFNLLKAVRTNYWLWRKRKALSAELLSDIENLFSAHGIKSSPGVWQIDGISQPFVWGLLRGSIYLPADLLNVKDPKRCRNLLGHELSHIIRFDAAVNFLQVVVQAIFWFHPFVWWANKKIRAEREKCCDEMAVARLNASPRDYSTAIVETLVAKHESTRSVPSLAVAGPVKNIEERIKTIMRPGKKFYKRPSLIAAISILLVAFLIVPTALVLTARAETEPTAERQVKPAKSLHQAVADGDIERVQSLLSKGADVNKRNQEGRTPLHLAAGHGHKAVVELLLARGAAVNAEANNGATPLHTAAYRAQKGVLEMLIAKGANVNAKNQLGQTPLHTAAEYGHKDVAELLISKGADINARDNEGLTPVEATIWVWPERRKEAKAVAELLVAKGANVPAIHWSAFVGDVQKVKKCLGEGVDVNAKEGRIGYTPLHCAAFGGQKDVINVLIDEDAEVNAKTEGLTPLTMGITPLHAAVASKDTDVAKLLLEKGADVKLDVGMMGTALHIAAMMGQPIMAELLIANGADAKVKGGPMDVTPLQMVLFGATVYDFGGTPTAGDLGDLSEVDRVRVSKLWKQRKALAELLLSAGADVKAVSSDTLHALARLDGWEIVEPLIAHGLDINAKHKGTTALHTAAEYGSKGMTKLLVANGADLNVQDNQGRTPLSLAKEKGHEEIIELLRKHGAKE